MKIHRLLGTAAATILATVPFAGAASADTTFDTGLVTVVAQTRAVRVGVGGVAVVSVSKVSDPAVQVRVVEQDGSAPVGVATHEAGQNGCSAADNPNGGTLNRTITVQGAPSATVYAKVQFTVTSPDGASSTVVLEPLGAGVTVSGLALVVGLPIDVCVA